MKFGWFIKDSKKIFFFRNQGESETGKLVPDFLLFFKKALYE